jgi:hypothetical protein
MWHRLQTYALGVVVLLLGMAVAMALTSVTAALLLLRDTSGPVAAMPHAAGHPHRDAAKRFPSGPAEQAPAVQVPSEPGARYQDPAGLRAERAAASEMPWPETSPAPRQGAPRDAEGFPSSAIGQVIFTGPSEPTAGSAVERTPAPRSAVERTPAPSSFTPTRALETVDPRELLRQATMPK